MTFLKWDDSYNIGIASIDEQHKRLVEIVIALQNSMTGGMSDDCFRGAFDSLIDATATHFRHEEALFENTAYPDAAVHRQQHSELLQHIALFRGEIIDRSDPEKSKAMMNFLRTWLLDHILTTDKGLGVWLNAQVSAAAI
jgi:hemerythrin